MGWHVIEPRPLCDAMSCG